MTSITGWTRQRLKSSSGAAGGGCPPPHPERDLIVRRYLKKQARLYAPVLLAMDEAAPPSEDPDAPDREENLEERVSLRDQRLGSVQSVLKAYGARRGP